MTLLAPYLEDFFRVRLPLERGTSGYTIASYADSFRLLLDFASQRLRTSPSRLQIEELDAPLVLDFLSQLEKNRGNSPATRNVRLAAIKSFMLYLEYRVPTAINQIHRVRAIPIKKTDSKLVPFLTREEWSALINAPDPNRWVGVRDRCLLYLAITTGLRASELANVRVNDFSFQPEPTVTVHGKGRRYRLLPLWADVSEGIRTWVSIRGTTVAPEMFVTSRGDRLTRAGIDDIVRRHARQAKATCSSLHEKRVSPHVLRHTCAMIVLQATGDLRKVALWLGHASMQTAEIYTRVDPTEKLTAIESELPPQLRPGRFQIPDHLMAFLKEASLCGGSEATKPHEKQP